MYTEEIVEMMENPKECLTVDMINDCQSRIHTGIDINRLLYDKEVNCFTFDKGFVIFEIKKGICYIYVYYRNDDCKWTAKELWENFISFLKVNGVDIVRMETTIKPEFWEKKYGFKLGAYLMEKRI
jgi:hypothetical protein